MTFPTRWDGPRFKEPKGAATLRKEKKAREESAADLLVKQDVRARDKKCRIPLKHKCRGGLECMHILDASLGGAMTTANLILGCQWIHRKGPVSVHGKQIEVRPKTKRGADGPCSFWFREPSETRAGEWGPWQLIATESAPGVIER